VLLWKVSLKEKKRAANNSSKLKSPSTGSVIPSCAATSNEEQLSQISRTAPNVQALDLDMPRREKAPEFRIIS